MSIVRPCRPGDLPHVVDIGNRAWQPIYAHYRSLYGEDLFPVLYPDADHAKGRQIERHFREHPEWMLVCEKDGTVVGFATFLVDAERKMGILGNNAVDPECGLKGIGQRLYQAVFDHLRGLGLVAVQVTTGRDPAHEPARNAYQRAGFSLPREDVTYTKRL